MPFRFIESVARVGAHRYRITGLVIALMAVVTVPAFAQHVETTTLSDDGKTLVLRFDIVWPRALSAAVDSVGVEVWSWQNVEQLTGGILTVSETVALNSARLPRVSVLDRSFDEVRVSASGEPPAYASADAWAEGLGWYRKRPVAEVTVRLASLDASDSVVRRMRSLTLSIERSGTGEGDGAGAAKTSSAANPHLSVTTSALSDGTLFKLAFTEEGMYRIDRGFLEAIGVDPDSVDPDKISILGNGGQPLPAVNSAFRYPDVVENAVIRRGGGDGSFDPGDEVVFYARGPSGWTIEDGSWAHYVNPFSNFNALFLKIGVVDGASVPQGAFPAGLNPANRVATQGRFVLDVEEQVWSREHGSGHDWVSNTIRSGTSRRYLENVHPPGFTGGLVDYEARFAIASNPRATVAFESSGNTLAQRTAARTVRRSAEAPAAIASTIAFQSTVATGGALNLSMRLIEQLNEPEAALDWVRAFYDQQLTATDGMLRFATTPGSSGPVEYRMSGFSTTPTILDVTRPDEIQSLGVSSRAGTHRVRLTEDDMSAGPRELIAYTSEAVRPLSADQATPTPNQNLHGLASFPDFVIVAPAEFMEAADRLADHRRAEGLDVEVVRVSQIYNEFSGGVPDMRALRDYLKFLYDRAPDDDSMLRYALLLGDGHYDFRNLSNRESAMENHIFPYETPSSMDTDATYTSDDYFGLLDDLEGIWEWSGIGIVGTERVDIGIGRLPAQTASEANMMIDKIIQYESPATYGAWRSSYTFVADDGPTGLSGSQDDQDLHLANVDQVAELLSDGFFPDINIKKIYGESFERKFLNGFRIPEAKRAINNTLNSGTLILNYSGHGGPDGLAQEEIFTKEDAEALTNRERLSIFITATCSFGWWDLEETQSGAEALLLNDNGGAVALLTTVRLVYTSGSTTSLNAGLNRALNIEMFKRDAEGRPRRLGDVMLDTKNTQVGLQGNSRKFNLLGDPSMRVGLPEQSASVETLNGVDLQSTQGQMKALDRVSISGSVKRLDGSLDTNFDGIVNVTVFDAARRVPIQKPFYAPEPYYELREDLIWRGKVAATAGRFNAEFVVPKDISYSNEPGRISAYAAGTRSQALGFTENFVVGGTSDNPPDDDVGPRMDLFLNDTTFVDGGSVPAEPELIVKLFDESGINTVGAGVGHEMLLVIDSEDAEAQDIGSAFVAEENSFQRGEVRWTLDDIDSGGHTLTVRAWDVLNNSNEADLSFFIANDEVLDVSNVYNYPNPMSRETRFIFDHNQPAGTPAQVQVRIFTLSGRPIRTIYSEEALPDGILPSGPVQIRWDGRDDDLDRPATGIYLYRVRVKIEGPDGETQVSEHVEKLAYIR